MTLTPEQKQALLSEHIGELGLPLRTVNSLESFGIMTVEDLLYCCPNPEEECDCSNKHVLSIPNFGTKTLETTYRCLANFGFVKQPKSQQDT